ncbi:non-reducing polyketide synthase [Pyrenochaeta sp. MPI-SDFR-AT-0127]|nr:non-reducing polyketide synthase [Pyrenochaeta sp. MPI-SDFR-AT-0127]
MDPQRTVLLFGDYTEPWVESIDHLCRQARSTPWLQLFLNDIVDIFKDEKKHLEPFLQDSLGEFSNLEEIAEKFRNATDEISYVQGLMLYTVRAACLLKWIRREPKLLRTSEAFGLCGGLVNASVLAVAEDFDTLYDACVANARIFCRSCRLAIVRSRAIEDRPGSWGWVVVGISATDLRESLDQFQGRMEIPMTKRAKVGLMGDRWSTVIGPPSVLDLFFNQCPAVRKLPKNELNIHALQHALDLSETDLDYIVGDSPVIHRPIKQGFRLWGMDKPKTTYETWGELLRSVFLQVLAQPLDIVHVVSKLNKNLSSCDQVQVKTMGPTSPGSHSTYFVAALKESGRNVTVHNLFDQGTSRCTQDRIAIVGMAGQGPGCDNVEQFWDIISGAQDLHQEIPKDRFDLEVYLQSRHGNDCVSKSMSKFGCFIRKPGNFDARFFHISPREALLMEPGHRLFLMSAYEALEMAGYSNGPTKVTDPNKISTFFGQCNDDWRISSHDVKGCDSYTLPGIARAFGPGRVAFHFGWEGPTYSLDSACSSSCSSIHLACMSLLSKETDMAVAGAANVTGYPHSWISLSQSGVLSPTGNCKPFRDDGDGYCRADFSGAVVLKRLEDAIAHNDNILGVISGSGRNHSGNATSITTSDAGTQARLFRKVLRSAGVAPNDISYVEMHGTGTKVGDPAEMSAVSSIFGNRSEDNHLTVGAVKGNVGHSESAAGIASLLKCLMMFQKNSMPPQVGMPHALNPNFPPLSEMNIIVPSQAQKFENKGDAPRRILLNNFDAAGGNGCLLLEDYISPTYDREKDPRSTHTIVCSAKTPFSHVENQRNLLKWLQANPKARLADIAYTTTARRTHLPIRYAYTASTIKDLITKLDSNVNRDIPGHTAGRKAPIVFVFPGQGSHYAGMGAELYMTNAIFRRTIDLCVRISQDQGFPSYLDIITDKDSVLSTKDAIQTQLALVTLEMALIAFWNAIGIRPDMVVGHSLGEYVALHAAGVLSIADVLYLVGRRARLLQERCEAHSCAMLAVSASTEVVEMHMASLSRSSCAIACVNSPSATVVSGPSPEISNLEKTLTAANVRSKTLPVPYAFHSLQIDPILNDFASLARIAAFAEPKIPIASTLLGSVIPPSCGSSDYETVFDAEYLSQQARQKVEFVGALHAINAELDQPIWLELGPTQVCGAFVRNTLQTDPSRIMSTLENGSDVWASVSNCVAKLFNLGIDIDWLAYHRPYETNLQCLKLPSYAWDLRDYWIPYTEPASSQHAFDAAQQQQQQPTSASIVSTCAQYVIQDSASPELKVMLGAAVADNDFKAFLDGHRLRGVPVAPGCVFMEAALTAGKYLLRKSGKEDLSKMSLVIQDLNITRPVTEKHIESKAELITTAVVDGSSSDTIVISFGISDHGQNHGIGACRLKISTPADPRGVWGKSSFYIRARMEELIADAKSGQGHRLQPDIFYALFSDTVEYGNPFRGIKEAFISKDFGEAAAKVVLQNDPPGTKFTASPYWADSLVQLPGFLINGNPSRPKSVTFMMASFESYEQIAEVKPGKPYFTYVRISQREKDTVYCDAFVFDEEELIIHCSNCVFHEVKNVVLEHLLGKSKSTANITAPTSNIQLSVPETSRAQTPQVTLPTGAAEQRKLGTGIESDSGLFDAIIASIVKATGGSMDDLTDDTAIADMGVDSIMGIEIIATIKDEIGTDLPASFVMEYPTIGHLRAAFGTVRPSMSSLEPTTGNVTPSTASSTDQTEESLPTCGSSEILPDEVPDSTPALGAGLIPALKNAKNEKEMKESIILASANVDVEDDSPPPRVRISLIQGRPAPGKPRFHIMADGSGSIATYIHLPPLKINLPVYGVNSPYLQCPSRFTAKSGIEEASKHVVEALMKAQPDGPFFLGGFSGGAMLCYEVTRQLAALGRKVEGLVLIDMCCPRPEPVFGTAKQLFDADVEVFESVTAHIGASNLAKNMQQHLRALFAAVAAYRPPPLTAAERPDRTAIIWADKGMISRCNNNPDLMRKLAEHGLTPDSPRGFMEDPSLGAITWSIMNKGPENSGPNGWERYIGYDPLCLSVDADHLGIVAPDQVHLLRAALEQAFDHIGCLH